MMGGPGRLFGEVCSNKAREDNTSKRLRGRPVKVGHFHDDVGQPHFVEVLLSPGLEMLPILADFRLYLRTIPRTVILKTNNDR
jgi:hypothetical protein